MMIQGYPYFALKKVFDTLAKNYDITLLDIPAGLEQFA